jgi:hypothetical protein
MTGGEYKEVHWKGKHDILINENFFCGLSIAAPNTNITYNIVVLFVICYYINFVSMLTVVCSNILVRICENIFCIAIILLFYILPKNHPTIN